MPEMNSSDQADSASFSNSPNLTATSKYLNFSFWGTLNARSPTISSEAQNTFKRQRALLLFAKYEKKYNMKGLSTCKAKVCRTSAWTTQGCLTSNVLYWFKLPICAAGWDARFATNSEKVKATSRITGKKFECLPAPIEDQLVPGPL